MSDKMREEFEAVIREDAELSGNGEPDMSLLNCMVEGRAIYSSSIIQACWWAWQASRSALVIELPSALSAPPYASYEGGWNDMREEAQDAIHAVGAKSK